jgi:two-component system CheB/CheR fusion protein
MSVYVGIGTSAGGLNALEKLVKNLPAYSQNVYFIVQHLPMGIKSNLANILSRFSPIPVLDATPKSTFETNSIYIIPPSHNLVVKKHRLVLEEILPSAKGVTPSVDTLLTSLAEVKKKNAIGIILTGTGQDGTLGLEKIRQNGGITIAQSPEEAEYSSMPQSAIDSLEIDFVLPLEKIAHYLASPNIIQDYSESVILSDPIKTIINLLHKHENLDINKYKSETIFRRIQKRMVMVKMQTFEDYLTYIYANKGELHQLHQNILIGVTSFFRDKEAFNALENRLFLYLQDKPEHYELRVWSVACSSGEEAYSLAILISKVSAMLDKIFDVHIFATDIDEKALAKARKALYSKETLQTLDKDILDTYFIEVEDGYKIIQSLRSQVVFTNHNILSHPPFINQDLIACRNFLIYILPEIQKEVFKLFHYSLKENGILFLGSSESTMNSVEYFTHLDSENKIYIKEKLANPPRLSSHYFSQHTKQENSTKTIQTSAQNAQSMQELLKENIFTFFAENCIVVDKNLSIIYKQGALPFMQMPDGFATLNILENLNLVLRYDVGVILKKCLQTQTVQSTKFIELELPSSKKTFLKISAHPFRKTQESFLILLYFQELSSEELQFNSVSLTLPDESYVIESLTKQLNETKNELYLLSDELLINKENTQLLSEELQSSNEELQSSNEELESSNEELQSSNEELHTSIVEAQKLQEQLSLILNSSDDGILGLDINGEHTFVNAAAVRMLGYSINELVGKNGHKLWHHTNQEGAHVPKNECHLHSSIKAGYSARSEDLFWRKDGTSFKVEVLQNPVVKGQQIIGAVLSFRDITEKNTLKKMAEHEHELAQLYMDTSGMLVMKLDTQGNIELMNAKGCKLLKLPSNEIIGKNWFEHFVPLNLRDAFKKAFFEIMSNGEQLTSTYKNVIINADKEQRLISWTNSLVKDENGVVTGIVSSGLDITNEAALSQKLFEQENLYKLTFEEADIGIAHVSLDGNWIDTNDYLSKLLGYTKKEFQKISVKKITHPDDVDNDKIMLQELLGKKRSSYHKEKRYIHKNGKVIWVSLNVVLLFNDLNEPLYFLKIIRDISEIKLLMYQLQIEKNELNRIIKFTPIPIIIHNIEGEIILLNQAWEQSTGYTIDEIPTMKQLGNKLYKNYPSEQQKIYQDDYKKSNTMPSMEHIITAKSGEQRIWQLKSVALYGAMETKDTFITSIIDITDIQNKEEIMIAQSRQAAMGEMLAMIAHQWRQPLSVISMTTNTLRAQQELEEEITDEELTQSIQTISEQTNYLSNTIDDFRSFFRPEKAKEKLKLSLIFERLSTLISKSLQDHSIVFEFSKYEDMELLTYPNQLIQIMINLINNAKDAIIEQNSTNGSIRIDVTTKKEELIISVIDNGGGIDPAIKDIITQPYVSTKSKNGTGLGLYMSTVIARRSLNARLFWKSNTKGSSFSIALSLAGNKEESSS